MSSLRDYQGVSRSLGSTFSSHFCLIIGLIFRSIHVIADCGNMEILEKGGISCSLLKDIVSTHNELRESIAKGLVKNQPTASDMREFYWDEELASGAQHWANQCTFAHDEDKDREVARFQVGQNLAMTKSRATHPATEKEFSRHIRSWFSEYENFEFGPIETIEDLQSIGHYTQVAWADTYLVGCGYSRYRSSSNITYRLYVCNYGPTGNELGAEPYRRGMQKCPESLIQSRRYPYLCSLTKKPENRCGIKQKEKDTRENVNEYEKKQINHPDGRKFLSSPRNDTPGTTIYQSERRDELKQDNSQVYPTKVNIFFNFFFPHL